MKNQYVPKTLSEFLGESKSITLKRKYGERPTIIVGANAPLRNQVLSYVAESGSVSKRDLKQFIMGLKEGGSTVAAANMFIKRNAKYFLAENKNGITYFKLSNLGKRLVNQFVSTQDLNVSESFLRAKRKLSSLIKESKKSKSLNESEYEENWEESIDDEELLQNQNRPIDIDDEAEDDSITDDSGPADEVDFDEDRFDEESEDEEDHAETDQFEYEEDDEKITLTYYKNGGEDEDELEDEGEELPEDDFEDDDELEDEGEELSEEDFEGEDELEEDADRPMDEPREYDFKDKGRPGVYDMDESAGLTRAQFVSHKLAGTKKSKLAGRYSSEYHNLLDDSQEKDDSELKNHIVKSKKTGKLSEAYHGEMMLVEEFEEFIDMLIGLKNKERALIKLRMMFDKYPAMHAHVGEIPGQDEYKNGLKRFREFYYKRRYLESVQVDESNRLGGKLDADLHNLLGDEDKDDKELDDLDKEITENEEIRSKMKQIIENLKVQRQKTINEAEEPEESDELSDEDINSLDDVDEPEPDVTDDIEVEEPVEDVERVEITEFIITVDNVDEAIDQLSELGVTAERVPAEPKEEEIPAEVEEPEMPEEPAEGTSDVPETPEQEPKVKESLDEAEETDLGSSDELGLGDQGEEAPELDESQEPSEEETLEPTTEFEENKIKVKAEDWEILKGWLEQKGVNISDMFGGDIEMEEVPVEEEPQESPEEPTEEISDEDIDFSGISDDDSTKVS